MKLPRAWGGVFCRTFTQLGYPRFALTREGLTNQIEDGICLLLKRVLENRGSEVFLEVKGVGFPIFDTDVDVLELREDFAIAYEVKGLRQRLRGRTIKEKFLTGVKALEGLEQAMNHLFNAGYSVDYAYLVHPVLSFYGYVLRTARILETYTPIGYLVVDPTGEIRELVRPKSTERMGEKMADVPRHELLAVSEIDVRSALEKKLKRFSGLPLDITEKGLAECYSIIQRGSRFPG